MYVNKQVPTTQWLNSDPTMYEGWINEIQYAYLRIFERT
jgi:hypothetical protein